MKILSKIVMHGAECSKRTAWKTWAGFTMLHFTDGSTKYLPECGIDSALSQAEAMGADCADFKRRQAEASKVNSYPEKPESAELFLHNYGYEKPVSLGQWDWSTTFGRWGRTVTFSDGWHGFTYPKPN